MIYIALVDLVGPFFTLRLEKEWILQDQEVWFSLYIQLVFLSLIQKLDKLQSSIIQGQVIVA